MKQTLAMLLLLTTSVVAQTMQSPAEIAIVNAQKTIEKKPTQFSGYNQLAIALARRARETSDVNFYTQAEEALKKSQQLAPENYEGQKLHVWLLLGRHEFAAALNAAKELNKKMPDDILVYGFMVDANVELGNYDDAEKSAQWMLNLRPGNMPALTRTAYLRELFGDIDGSYELMQMAFQGTPPTENEDRAWIMNQMAHLDLAVGKTAEAENILQQALTIFPGYHYALGNLAKVRIVQKRYAEAVDLLQQRYKAAPHAENLYDLAVVLKLAGRSEEASAAFVEFEKKSLAETMRRDNSNHELVSYYTDEANQPAKALEIAQREYNYRHDVFTLDAYAWALHKNNQDAEARKQIEVALAVGIRDAKLFRHAGEIALSQGDRKSAMNYLQTSVTLDAPGSEEARERLASLQTAQASVK
ncbi:MAG TPA: tetratricopeptide repeat protein [Terriglobales bacterium]